MNQVDLVHGAAASATADARSADVSKAVDVLRRGGLIALPTETVYGLAADALNPAAVARIFAAKGRPADHPLIVHLHRASQISIWARHVPLAAWELAEAFWPGPLTMILPRMPAVLSAVTGGLDTVALRVPAHPLALEVIEQLGNGIAAPSANRHKKISPTSIQHVQEELSEAVDFLLDGGPCTVGIESTIVDLCGERMRVLRPGAITTEDLQRVTGLVVDSSVAPPVRCPGRMDLHYSPRARVVLAAIEQVPSELAACVARDEHVGVLAAHRSPAWPAQIPWLPLGHTFAEQAQHLYERLREADRMDLDVLVVVPPSDRELGHALRDRLWRAAGLGDAPA